MSTSIFNILTLTLKIYVNIIKKKLEIGSVVFEIGVIEPGLRCHDYTTIKMRFCSHSCGYFRSKFDVL